ncbi:MULTISPECIES: enoyl-CoA hydratase/isomerase family protein [unclassified Pseudomonas]|uniref:enoyl-CoA hydratase/isomerase family protein n=1 Tax=unclassified Pseudomonas TaxID=196821 RepID=UPI000BD2712A|nr:MULTISPECIES: enoyl-CoA hydratase/isomerase family protein [unclassified Pseudomonas]PVZ20543.1 enoyl-CoA hydratase [Pseudomonas sp. URIL14HWK12:I12]PVZ27609.1 enoyl-CoA hydratase [Pseudomonas sp. URIL14HWK12:I10]PVZ38498.1 enoyl-CoA hydratase [Pseudomonas sp. URIL14HWK12:I11]SNZ03120.1 enoyl-CoA hydratase [Pseudomonas sp. URIL14HWK12:I9]
MNLTTAALQIDPSRPIARLTLNRPQARNALNTALCHDLHQAVLAVAENPAIHVLIIDANGPVFCAGADLKERQGMDDDQIRARRLRAFALYAAIEALPIPVFAVLDGPAVGSGCEIACACDFVIASSHASLRYPEARWGTVGATQRLPRIVGRRMAKELMFSGRAVEAQEALRIGLVNRVVAREALAACVDELAATIADGPSHALRSAKRLIDSGLDDSRHGALAREILAIEENLNAGVWKAGMSTFSGGTGRD